MREMKKFHYDKFYNVYISSSIKMIKRKGQRKRHKYITEFCFKSLRKRTLGWLGHRCIVNTEKDIKEIWM
jgi:hypothetical protein